ncbi:hypothetical protein JCM17846_32750 [Iodidimonas nitroreducens]|uniref:Glycosidase n=1 Tax=Iodidimonas nitroreducens TaxID=1236968 RepID=A0A5A7NB13_9PROT|nr:DUF2840 domain-containing protein [Iodidimonas nitroreducens]GER05593.1 hypothetical protein JCM17846_32750 [Iodidimonas nitroreducens]
MSEHFTRVEIVFYPEHLNHWLRFGAPDVQQDLDRRRSLALFKPGQVFGYIRWRANEYGTQEWRFTIVRAAEPSLLLSRIPGVCPGGEVLLLVTGNTKVKRALLQIDVLEADASIRPTCRPPTIAMSTIALPQGSRSALIHETSTRHIWRRERCRREARAAGLRRHSGARLGRRVYRRPAEEADLQRVGERAHRLILARPSANQTR